LSKHKETSNYTVFPTPSIVLLQEAIMSTEEDQVADMLKDLRDTIPEEYMTRFSHIITQHGFVLVHDILLQKVVDKKNLPKLVTLHIKTGTDENTSSGRRSV